MQVRVRLHRISVKVANDVAREAREVLTRPWRQPHWLVWLALAQAGFIMADVAWKVFHP